MLHTYLKYPFFVLFAILLSPHFAYALTIEQIPHKQVAGNTGFNITALADQDEVVWLKEYGPDWVDVDAQSGDITGVTPNVAEAHYVALKALAPDAQATMVFILIVGEQNILRMDGLDANPVSIADAYEKMQGGDVLIIPDGIYSGEANTFNGQASVQIKSGSESAYTTWIAESPGQVTLPSIISQGAAYVAYKGLHFEPSTYSSGVTVSGTEKGGRISNHVKFMLSSTQDGGFNAINGAHDVLFEDVFAYGDSRAVFRVGSTGNPSRNIIFRRAVARHDYTTNSNPTAVFMHYGGENVLFQNGISIDQSRVAGNFSASYDHYGAWESKNGDNVYVKDSIALNMAEEFHFGDTNTTNVRFSNSVFWDIGTGSTTRSADVTYKQLTVGNVNAQNSENVFDDRSGAGDVYFTDSIFYDIEGTGTNVSPALRSKTILGSADESSNNLFYPVQNDIVTGDTSDIITDIDPVDGTPGNGYAGILYPIRTEPGSDVYNMGLGATVLYKRGVSGTLWGEPGYDDLTAHALWPWPNENMIKSKMAAADVAEAGISVAGVRGFTLSGESLSNYIWGYLGNTPPPFQVVAIAGNSEVYLSWTAPAESSRNAISEFRIYDVSGTAEPRIPGDFKPVKTVTGNSLFQATVSELTNGQAYTFAVTAVNPEKGESSYSYLVTATPTANSTNIPTSNPDDTTNTAKGDSSKGAVFNVFLLLMFLVWWHVRCSIACAHRLSNN